MEIITTLVLVTALIVSFYYWTKCKERDVFWLMILAFASLLLKGWKIVEDNYFEFPDSVQNIFFVLRTLFSTAIVAVIIKILFFSKKINKQ